jgi:2-haloacid dehalogenase
MMIACHPSDLAAARAAGLRTGFIPRPAEFGPGGSSDPKGDWDIVADDLGELARRLGA